MKKSREHTLHYLQHSLELRTLLRDVLIYTGIVTLMLLSAASQDRSGGGGWWLTAALLLLPVWVFCIWRVIRIFRQPESYWFCQCQLSQPHVNPFLKAVYFSVWLELPGEGAKCVDTHAIFATHGIIDPIMENYVNRTVTIAYNPETHMVVVIG